MNAIALRSGKELESPQMAMREDRREVDSGDNAKKEVPTRAPNERVHTEKTKEA